MVQRMADVERAGHIRRRNDDTVGLAGVVGVRMKIAPVIPDPIPSGFDGFGVIRFVELRCSHGWGAGQIGVGILTRPLAPANGRGALLVALPGLCYTIAVTQGPITFIVGSRYATRT